MSTRREVDRLIVRGAGWLAVSLGGGQAISFVSTLALARLLEPKQFGLVAIATTVLTVAQEFQDSGMANALIYRREDIKRAAGSVLVFPPISAVVLVTGGFFAAPAIARLLGNGGATNVVRALLFVLLIRAFGTVSWAILERSLAYRARARIDLTGALAQAVIAVALAAAGAGVWSLIVGQMVGAAVIVLVSWSVLPWRPSPRDADWQTFRQLMRYGRWSGSARIANIVNRNVDNVVVARLLGVTPLGYYAVAFRLGDVPVTVAAGILGRVMFPAYSMLQEDLQTVRRLYLENLQRLSLILAPIAVGLIVDAKPIVLALLGAKWMSVIGPLRIFGIWVLIRTLTGSATPVFDGRGKPYLGLISACVSSASLIALLLVLVPRYGVEGAAASQAASGAIAGFPALLVALRLIGMTPRTLARGLAAPALCTAIVAVSLTIVTGAVASLSAPLQLVLLAVAGLLTHAAASAVLVRDIVGAMVWSIRGGDSTPT